jgi:hypothetical protein
MKRVLVVTWALGTATGVLLGLFGVQLVSSRFETAGVSPLSRPEVLRALQAATHPGPAEVALSEPSTPDTTPTTPPVDAAPARPSAETTSNPAPAPPASTLPRPGATAGDLVASAAAAPSTTSTAPPDSSTTTTTTPPADNGKSKSKSDKAKGSDHDSSPATTATTAPKKATTTTAPASTKPVSPSQAASGSDTRSINSTGGVVAVRYSGGNVQLKWARPNPGYQVYVRDNGPDQVIVYFYTRNHISQVAAYYNGDTPAFDVQESSIPNQGGHH